ncbi:hypothetical protein E1A91_D10G000600v1 [Gossypium mustelinum]|uniref:Uncharacterized protein n=1 Tax=Gossypium mustelinum TaxID=34275 RepID=A0A5D2T3B2_GOSMU|nr:hypothetical protein E1A91_D10G000600v1 [Gossypium mustelinum]
MNLTLFLSFSSLFLVSNICFFLLIFSVDFCQGFLFSYSKSHCYVPLKLWISVWASVLAFGPVSSLVYGLLGFYPSWRLSDPICKCTKTKVSLLWTSAIHINQRYLSTI